VGVPAAFAAARIFGTQSSKNEALTCFAVSTRKPSTWKRETHDAWIRARPFDTFGFSVKRSSRPKKSPCSKHCALHEPKSMLPRSW
jgi:hypothetical protein